MAKLDLSNQGLFLIVAVEWIDFENKENTTKMD
jgi:hypothetical protein